MFFSLPEIVWIKNPTPCCKDSLNSLSLQDSGCYFPYSSFAGQLPTRLQTESEQGMPGFPSVPLLQNMQVILDDDSFEVETMNCVNQTFSQRLKTGAWQKRGAGKH